MGMSRAKGISLPILAATYVILWLLWLMFTNSFGFREIIAGMFGAGISTIAVGIYARQSGVTFRFHWRDVLRIWCVPWDALQGTAQVMIALGNELFGDGAGSFLRAVPFDVGDPHDPFDASRRALAITYTTITPNVVALGIVMEERLLLYHQLNGSNVPDIAKELGARD